MIQIGSRLGAAFVLLVIFQTILNCSFILPYGTTSAGTSSKMDLEATINAPNDVGYTAAITAKDRLDPPSINNSAIVTLNEAGIAAETSIVDIQDGDGVVVVDATIQRIKDSATSETVPTPIGCYQANATYNPSGIQLITLRAGNPPFDSPVFNVNSEEGSVALTQYATEATTSPVTVAKLVPVLIGCTFDSYQLQMAFNLIADPDGQQIPEEAPHSLTFQRGDVNGDGLVNIIDAMFGAQYLVGRRPVQDICPLNMASVHHDGAEGDKKDIIDCMYIAQYVIGLRDCYFISTTPQPTPTPTPTPTPAPVPATTVGNLTLIPTFKCVSVYASFTGDTDTDNSAMIQYKKSNDASWETGMTMVVDRNTQLSDWFGYYTNPWYDTWKVSIVGLDSNTSYDIQVTFSDDDGVAGFNPVRGTISTRNEAIPIGSTARYVSKSGSNDNDGTAADASHAWLTIAYGLAHISAGDTLYVESGNYTEYGLDIPSGTSWSNLTSVCNYGNDSVTVSGGAIPNYGSAIYNPFHCTGDYWRIKGLTLTDSDYAGVEVDGCSHYLIENCTIGNSYGNVGYCGLIYNYNAFDGIMRHITFFNTFAVDNTYDGPNEIAAITFQNSRGRYIVHDINYASSNTDRYFADFIGNHGMQFYNSGPFCDSDFYNINMEAYYPGSTYSTVGDNAIELRTGSCNVRVFDCTFKNMSDCPISLGPLTIGPCYIFHNVAWRQSGWIGYFGGDVALKCGSNEGGITTGLSHGYVFVYNNTFYNIGAAYGPWYGGDIWNQTYMNNIFWTNSHSGYLMYQSSNLQNMHIDYNCYYQPGYIVDLRYGATTSDFSTYFTIPSFYAASGYEQHGVGADPQFGGDDSQPTAGNFTLLLDSPCRNAGAVIQGFNDPSGPHPYSGLAPDIGAVEYQESTPTPTPTPTATQP